MKILIVYDSMYGNTAKVARAIADAVAPHGDLRLLPVPEATPAALVEAELLFVGSPTQRFRPLPAVSALLARLPRGSLAHARVAAFDTRIVIADAHSSVLSFFVRLLGPSAYAAHRILRALRRAGGRTALPGEGFYVDGTEGPLKDGELERAGRWGLRALGEAQPAATVPTAVAAMAGAAVPATTEATTAAAEHVGTTGVRAAREP